MAFVGQGKKQNTSPSPDCSPLNRSYFEILGHPPTQRDKSCNTWFDAFLEEEEEFDEESTQGIAKSSSESGTSEGKETDTMSITTDTLPDSKANSSSPLSRRSQVALRQLWRAQKILQDTSVQDEILSVLGPDHAIFNQNRLPSGNESIIEGLDSSSMAMEIGTETDSAHHHASVATTSTNDNNEITSIDNAQASTPCYDSSPANPQTKQVTFAESVNTQPCSNPRRDKPQDLRPRIPIITPDKCSLL